MKLKFLDVRNCRTLLPPSNGLPVLKRLDECLQGINERDGGSIQALMKQNQKTYNRTPGSKRLCYSPVRIAQNSDVLSKTVHTQAIVLDIPGPSELHTLQIYENRIVWKTIVPLQFILKGWGDAGKGHQCYIHSISHNMNKRQNFNNLQELQDHDSDDYYYVGITGRNWLLRLTEHIGEIRRGSGKRFHMAWRESIGMTDVLFVSYLRDINQTFEDAMSWEERKVDKIAFGPNGLNMIPGGFKGLKFLHKHRITNRVNIDLEEREIAIAKFARQNPRKGIPNPFIAELWKDDEYYLKIIEARPKTLSQDQVRKIRVLYKSGRSVAEITKDVGALDQAQVKRVIEGKTYKRYH